MKSRKRQQTREDDATYLRAQAAAAVENASLEFRRVFGRLPRGRDRLLAYGLRHDPAHWRKTFRKMAEETDVARPVLYATSETGLIVAERNEHLIAPEDRADWDAAVAEYLAALEDGVDLLEPERSKLDDALDTFGRFIEDAVVHVGSYIDRSPIATRKSLPLFFQFLLLSKCHKLLKGFADSWPREPGEEILILVRSLYECTLLILRLEVDPEYSTTILAQALVESDLYGYRIKKDGTTDFNSIIEKNTGKVFKAKTSYAECARLAGEEHKKLFDILYPILSDRVHFQSLSELQRFRNSGKFLDFDAPKPPVYAAYATIITSYLGITVTVLRGATAILKRDASFLLKQAQKVFYPLLIAFDDDDYDVEPELMIACYAADRFYRGEPLI